jgi:hypothetical protein
MYRLILFIFMTFVLLFFGCSPDDEHIDTGFIPVGEWVSQYDKYIITNTHIHYSMDNSEWDLPDDVLKGNIERAIDFSDNSGVLIIRITEATWFTVNNFTGLYYSEYSKSSIKMTQAYEGFDPVETASLSAALSLFTVDNAGDHTAMWGTYTK